MLDPAEGDFLSLSSQPSLKLLDGKAMDSEEEKSALSHQSPSRSSASVPFPPSSLASSSLSPSQPSAFVSLPSSSTPLQKPRHDQATQTSPSLSAKFPSYPPGRSARDRISLNVGGRVYDTTAETLLTVRGSYFTALLSSAWRESQDEEEEEDGRGRGRKQIFVDRNGDRFSYILDYLRDGVLVCPLEKSLLQGLLLEAKFFGLPSLVSEIQASLDLLQKQQACRAIQYASERLQAAAAVHAAAMSSCSSSSSASASSSSYSSSSPGFLFLPPSPVLTDPFTTAGCLASGAVLGGGGGASSGVFPAWTRRIPGGTGILSSGSTTSPSAFLPPPPPLPSSSSACSSSSCVSTSASLFSASPPPPPPVVASAPSALGDAMHYTRSAATRDEGFKLSTPPGRETGLGGIGIRRGDGGEAMRAASSTSDSSSSCSSLSPSSSSSSRLPLPLPVQRHPPPPHPPSLPCCDPSSSSSATSRGSSRGGSPNDYTGKGGGRSLARSDSGLSNHNTKDGRSVDSYEDSLELTDDGYRRSLINDDPDPPKPLVLDLLTTADAQLRFGERVFRTDADF